MSQRVESPGLGDAGNAILNGGNEATPLLSSPVYESEDEDQDQDTTPDGDSGPNQPLKSTSSISHHHRSRCTWPWIYVVALTIAIAIVSDIGENLYGAPRLRLFESVICTRHYLVHDPSRVDDHGAVPEQLCKIDPVQDKLAQVLGWQFFFDSVPAILLPIPYGYLADKYGRKWFLVLALAGLTLSYASTLYLVSHRRAPAFIKHSVDCSRANEYVVDRGGAFTHRICLVILPVLPHWRGTDNWDNSTHHHRGGCRAT